MIKYGLISETDGRTIEKTLDLILKEASKDETINIAEIGLFDCGTANGIWEYLMDAEQDVVYTGVDNFKDKQIATPEWMKFIFGNSNEVYNQLEDNSQHMILIDANHSFPSVISDYYCYRSKIKKGGFLCFHDTSPQAQGLDWQRMGSETDPDMSITVRKALNEIGLLNDRFNISSYREHETISRFSWDIVFDEFDPNDRCGGICVFKKLY